MGILTFKRKDAFASSISKAQGTLQRGLCRHVTALCVSSALPDICAFFGIPGGRRHLEHFRMQDWSNSLTLSAPYSPSAFCRHLLEGSLMLPNINELLAFRKPHAVIPRFDEIIRR